MNIEELDKIEDETEQGIRIGCGMQIQMISGTNDVEETPQRPIWNFFHPPLRIDKNRHPRMFGEPQVRYPGSNLSNIKDKVQLKKPNIEEQWKHIKSNRWENYSGDLVQQGNRNIEKENMFENIFSPTLFLHSTDEKNKKVFKDLSIINYLEYDEIKELAKTSKDIKNRMIEDKKLALKLLEEQIDRQVELYESKVNSRISERERILEITKNFEEKLNEADIIFTPNSPPLSQIILKCSDALSIILQFLETQDLLLNVSSTCSFFYKYIVKYVPLNVALNHHNFELIPFEKILERFKIKSFSFGDEQSIGNVYHHHPLSLITRLKTVLETQKHTLRELKIYNLHEFKFSKEEKLDEERKKKNNNNFRFKRINYVLFSREKQQELYDCVCQISRLEKLTTHIIPNELTSLRNLKTLVYPINFRRLLRSITEVNSPEKKKKGEIQNNHNNPYPQFPQPPPGYGPGSQQDDMDDRKKVDLLRFKEYERLIEYFKSSNSKNLENIILTGEKGPKFGFGGSLSPYINRNTNSQSNESIVVSVFSFFESLFESISSSSSSKITNNVKFLNIPFFIGFRGFSKKFMGFLGTRSFVCKFYDLETVFPQQNLFGNNLAHPHTTNLNDIKKLFTFDFYDLEKKIEVFVNERKLNENRIIKNKNFYQSFVFGDSNRIVSLTPPYHPAGGLNINNNNNLEKGEKLEIFKKMLTSKIPPINERIGIRIQFSLVDQITTRTKISKNKNKNKNKNKSIDVDSSQLLLSRPKTTPKTTEVNPFMGFNSRGSFINSSSNNNNTPGMFFRSIQKIKKEKKEENEENEEEEEKKEKKEKKEKGKIPVQASHDFTGNFGRNNLPPMRMPRPSSSKIIDSLIQDEEEEEEEELEEENKNKNENENNEKYEPSSPLYEPPISFPRNPGEINVPRLPNFRNTTSTNLFPSHPQALRAPRPVELELEKSSKLCGFLEYMFPYEEQKTVKYLRLNIQNIRETEYDEDELRKEIVERLRSLVSPISFFLEELSISLKIDDFGNPVMNDNTDYGILQRSLNSGGYGMGGGNQNNYHNMRMPSKNINNNNQNNDSNDNDNDSNIIINPEEEKEEKKKEMEKRRKKFLSFPKIVFNQLLNPGVSNEPRNLEFYVSFSGGCKIHKIDFLDFLENNLFHFMRERIIANNNNNNGLRRIVFKINCSLSHGSFIYDEEDEKKVVDEKKEYDNKISSRLIHRGLSGTNTNYSFRNNSGIEMQLKPVKVIKKYLQPKINQFVGEIIKVLERVVIANLNVNENCGIEEIEFMFIGEARRIFHQFGGYTNFNVSKNLSIIEERIRFFWKKGVGVVLRRNGEDLTKNTKIEEEEEEEEECE